MNTKEKIMLVSFVAISSFMMYEATSYSSSARLFPYLSGTVVLFGSAALLVQSYLPQQLQQIFEGDDSLSLEDDELVDSEEDDQTESRRQKSTRMRIDIGSPALAVAALLAAYVVFGFLFGILYITPLFVLAYGLWFRVPLHITILLSAVSAGIAYAFMEYTLTPIDEGFLLFVGGVAV